MSSLRGRSRFEGALVALLVCCAACGRIGFDRLDQEAASDVMDGEALPLDASSAGSGDSEALPLDASSAGSGDSGDPTSTDAATGTGPITDGSTEPDPLDAGSDAMPDASPPPEECRDLMVSRSSDPDTTCNDCTCTSCGSQFVACYGATDVASAGPAEGTPKAELCETLIACARASGCIADECYCGFGASVPCAPGSADGPCKEEVEAAAESTSPTTIIDRSDDTDFALGRANELGPCLREQCADECP